MGRLKCAFCEEYKKQIGIGEEEKKHGYRMELRAALFIKSVRKYGEPHYSAYSKPMRLRYCPSCGKEL